MKVEKQILAKIYEHEIKINEILELNREEWNDIHIIHIESYIVGRKALQWVLSDKDFIITDDYEKQAKYEYLCHDSSKIF